MAEEPTETGDRVNGQGERSAEESMLKPGTIDRDNRACCPGCLVYKPNNSAGHQVLSLLVLVSATPVLIATFTASSIGSLKGTSIRSRPCS
jgi:hypothetical protein